MNQKRFLILASCFIIFILSFSSIADRLVHSFSSSSHSGLVSPSVDKGPIRSSDMENFIFSFVTPRYGPQTTLKVTSNVLAIELGWNGENAATYDVGCNLNNPNDEGYLRVRGSSAFIYSHSLLTTGDISLGASVGVEGVGPFGVNLSNTQTEANGWQRKVVQTPPMTLSSWRYRRDIGQKASFTAYSSNAYLNFARQKYTRIYDSSCLYQDSTDCTPMAGVGQSDVMSTSNIEARRYYGYTHPGVIYTSCQ